MGSGEFRLPADAQAGDAVLAECPVCKKLVYVLVIPGSGQYLQQIMRQMEDALAAHVLTTGHDSQARRKAKGSGDGQR